MSSLCLGFVILSKQNGILKLNIRHCMFAARLGKCSTALHF